MTFDLPSDDRVSIEVDDARIAHVTFIRGDKMNALDASMFDTMIAAGDALAEAKDIRAVVVSGQGRAFCAGLDLGSMAAGGSDPGGDLMQRTHGNSNRVQAVAMQWRRVPAPVIAAVHGVCFGGGLQIASGADIRIVHPETRMAVMEMKWGLVPDMGGYALWRNLVRDDILRELTYTNREFSGRDAQAMGFATEVNDNPLDRARELARTIAAKNPDATKAAKRLFNRLPDMDEDSILLAESEEQSKIIRTPNQREAVMSQMEKRSANFVV
jgi:enoyl-CoA hydratase/carnithine racemase